MSIMPDPPTGHSRLVLAQDKSFTAAGVRQKANIVSAKDELLLLNSSAFDQHFYDFGEATMPIDQIGAAGLFAYEESDGANTEFAKTTPTATLQSHITADITADDSQISLMTLPQFLSGQNPWIEVGFSLESITELGIQIGFADPGPATAGKIVDDVDDTPTVDALITDCAIAAINTDDTIKTLRLISKDGTTVTGVTGAPTAAPYGIPTAATQVVYRVELRGQTAYCFVNGVLVATSGAAAGPQTSVLLECVLQWGNLHTDDKEVIIDYIDVGQERLNQPF